MKKLLSASIIIVFITIICVATNANKPVDASVLLRNDIELSNPAKESDNTLNIPIMVFTEEEAQELIDRLQAEKKAAEAAKKYENDLYCLAAIICQEAGGESTDIQLLVGNVVLNRVASHRYPNTIYEVATGYLQYGMMWKYGVKFPKWADQATINRCYYIAERLLDGERVCPANVIYQAEFEQGSGLYLHVRGFYFCYA